MIPTRRIFEICVFVAIALVAAMAFHAWLASHDEQLRLQSTLATQKQQLDAADARERDRAAAVNQTLAEIENLKREVQTPQEILRDLPQYLKLPQPITLGSAPGVGEGTPTSEGKYGKGTTLPPTTTSNGPRAADNGGGSSGFANAVTKDDHKAGSDSFKHGKAALPDTANRGAHPGTPPSADGNARTSSSTEIPGRDVSNARSGNSGHSSIAQVFGRWLARDINRDTELSPNAHSSSEGPSSAGTPGDGATGAKEPGARPSSNAASSKPITSSSDRNAHTSSSTAIPAAGDLGAGSSSHSDRSGKTSSLAAIPGADLKPLYDFVQDCRECDAKLSAAKQDHDDDTVKLEALTRERDAALAAAKGGTFWRRLRRNLEWLAVGAMVGATATAAATHATARRR